MMKKIVLLSCILFLVCYAATVYAQAPQILNFQGRLNDSSGQPAADGNYSIQFSIYPVASGGTAVWSQTQTVTTKNGVFNVLLSNVALDLSAAEYYLAMKVGSDAEMTPRQRIASVPYALQANPWMQNENHVYFNNISGNFGIGTNTPATTVHVKRGDSGQTPTNIDGLLVENSGHLNHWFVFQTATVGGGKSFSITNAGNVGIGTTTPGYTLDVEGTLHVSGADFAEPFDMTDITDLEKGDVVVIDPDNPIHLKKSVQAYDTLVAGVVSSSEQAGYVAGSRSDGSSDKPIALVGRVLCKVSAENGQIQTGDLLTTAATPGHAMKATDFERRQGAILGKALQAFDGETGQIMVLVTLQ